jgi:predicted enzyme related to lactoylglutathione lyase
MSTANRVVHFEIHAEDTRRAITFYESIFGWKFEKWGSVEYWIITTGPDSEPGINGGLVKRKGRIDGTEVIAYVCTVQMASVDGTVNKVRGLGGQNVVPKMPLPGVGWLAYCKDTEENIFGVMQADPSAT